ncbi:hypothetical protein K431DRAFT_295310 [Polychaeton citri CBS 116435]|uniref:RING-type domain-containing protein n=1 Tax=Polychaeton citri CBS 116435 TaxID=1314669 RepID=A0A9P4Q6N3_9PEZI|nr:hypothetical protein K431DRAFT_295310 [Polychaeton citri CBS 116435]
MPNDRRDFLANGLNFHPECSAIIRANNCAICQEVLSESIQIGNPAVSGRACGHIFHHRCIYEWLRVPGHNTCPICRHQLFEDETQYEDFESNEELAREVDMESTGGSVDGSDDDDDDDDQDNRSVWHSTLTPDSSVFEENITISRRVRIEPPSTHFFLHLATFNDNAYPNCLIEAEKYALHSDRRRTPGNVETRIDSTAILLKIVAMVNLIPVMAFCQGREYSADDLNSWGRLIAAIWGFLARDNGYICSANNMVVFLLGNVMDVEGPVSVPLSARRSEFVRGRSWPDFRSKSDDFDCLVNYIVYLARKAVPAVGE